MNLINWSDEKFSVGSEVLDNQHKQLINLINLLIEQYNDGISSETYCYIIDELRLYAHKHLFHEESLLEKLNFPELHQHKENHKSFISVLSEFENKALKSTFGLSEELLEFLTDWLFNHILISDMAYKPYFTNENIKL